MKKVLAIIFAMTVLFLAGCDKDDSNLAKLNEAFEKQLKASSYSQLTSNIVASGDMNEDDLIESVMYASIDETDYYFLVNDVDGTFINLGLLQNNYLDELIFVDAEIKALDFNFQSYAILQFKHVRARNLGYIIYEYNNDKIKIASINLPTDVDQIDQLLLDENQDGIYEKVSKRYYNDVQRHIVIESIPFGDENITYRLSYGNELKGFTYPDAPIDIIMSYIEAENLVNVKGLVFPELEKEQNKLVSNQNVLNKDLSFTANTESSNSIDLELVLVGFLENERVYYVKDQISQSGIESDYLFKVIKNNNEDKWQLSEIATSNEYIEVGKRRTDELDLSIRYLLSVDDIRDMPHEILEKQAFNFGTFNIYLTIDGVDKKIYESDLEVNGVLVDSHIHDKNDNGLVEIYFKEISQLTNESLLILEERNNSFIKIFYGKASEYIYLDMDLDGEKELITTELSSNDVEWWDGFTVVNAKNARGVYLPSKELTNYAHTNRKNNAKEMFDKNRSVENFKNYVETLALLGDVEGMEDFFYNEIYFVKDNLDALQKNEENSIGTYYEFSKYKALRYQAYWEELF